MTTYADNWNLGNTASFHRSWIEDNYVRLHCKMIQGYIGSGQWTSDLDSRLV